MDDSVTKRSMNLIRKSRLTIEFLDRLKRFYRHPPLVTEQPDES